MSAGNGEPGKGTRPRACSIPGCHRPIHYIASSLCHPHYAVQRRRKIGIGPRYVSAETLRAFLTAQEVRPLSRRLALATGRSEGTWERWIVRVKSQRFVQPVKLDEFATALGLHSSMFEESA